MKKLCFALALLCQFSQIVAQPLSEKATISLLTVAPGEEIYSIFGHSAIRVQDPERMMDRAYNYGTFEFDQPNFLLKFCRGKLNYFLNIEPTRATINGSRHDRRLVREQILNLKPEQKQRLFDLLEANALPENKNYKYDFFYDNCATRIRDIVGETFFHQISFDSTGLPPETSMRQLLKPYLAAHPWTDFGIDLVLGLPADRRARPTDWMFLPDHVHEIFGKTEIVAGQKLVAGDVEIPAGGYPKKEIGKRDFADRLFGNPFWMMILVVVIGLLSMSNRRAERIFDLVFWFVLGLAGLIIFLLWVATDHSPTKLNLNILWALPTHLLFFWRSRRSEFVDNYFVGVGILAGLALVFWKFLPQAMPLAALPLAILVVVKGLFRRFKGSAD